MDAISIVIILFLIIFFASAFIVGILVNKEQKSKKEQEKNNFSYNEDREFETIELKVKVVDQFCTTRMVGVKYPKSIEEYFISFEKDNGEVLKLLVPRECYDGFEIGQKGLLTLVDGELYSFKLD